MTTDFTDLINFRAIRLFNPISVQSVYRVLPPMFRAVPIEETPCILRRQTAK